VTTTTTTTTMTTWKDAANVASATDLQGHVWVHVPPLAPRPWIKDLSLGVFGGWSDRPASPCFVHSRFHSLTHTFVLVRRCMISV
jgi:hypothetical protein